MAKIEAAIKDAILRGARRQIRLVTTPLRREVRRMRQVVGQLRQDVKALREIAGQWRRTAQASPWKAEVTEKELKASRLSARLIRKLRTRLGLSQAGVAKLVGVSLGSVAQWERGRSEPSGEHRKGLVALRRLGRRDVKSLLAAMPPRPRVGKTRAVRRRKGRRGVKRRK